jgi:uncharacterized cupin superfamily protein
MSTPTPLAILASSVPPRAKRTNYPPSFAARVAGREKRPLGDLFGLHNFGVNLTRLAPGTESSALHRHSQQDEMIYILEGEVTLVTDAGETTLGPGMCAGFPANGVAHHLINRSQGDVLYLEIGDRSPGDAVTYPVDDLAATLGDDGTWRFSHKDGSPY